MVGGHNKSEIDGQLVSISQWFTHKDAVPSYGPKEQGHWDYPNTGSVDRDISIVILAKDVQFTKEIQPICLPLVDNQDYLNAVTFVSGWGVTKVLDVDGKKEYKEMSDVPQRVMQITMSEDKCNKLNMNECNYCGESTTLCAFGSKKFNETINEDSCGGDSGGNSLQLLMYIYFL